MNFTLFVADTETAGLDGGVADIGVVQLDADLNVVWQAESLLNPERPISPAASGVHHITDDMVVGKPTLHQWMQAQGFPFYKEGVVFCGHNVQFDVRMIGQNYFGPGMRKLCTLKLAREIYPTLVDHKLQTIRYAFKLDAGDAHRAMGDVTTCVSFLRHVQQDKGLTVEQMLAITQQPLSLDSKFPFGKHKGVPIRQIPKAYCTWALAKMDNLDPELRAALQRHVS